jgi:hypothetical protein
MRLGHALLSVFVRKHYGSSGIKMRIVIGMVEVPVAVNEVSHRGVAQAIESLLEPGPSVRNETVHHELAVRAVKDYHGSARAVDIVTLSASFCVSMGNVLNQAHIREQVGRRRLFCVRCCGGRRKRCARKALPASVTEPRKMSRREVCFFNKVNLMQLQMLG